MSACVIYRQLARRGHVAQCYKDVLLARKLHRALCDPEAEADEQQKETEAAVHPGVYRLHYNPTLYRRPKKESDAAAIKAKIDEDAQGFIVATPSFRQQSNHYSVSSSRRLSSTKNKLLDLAFNKASEDRTPPRSFDNREAQPSEDDPYKPDPRAFQRCRPEYASTTLDLSQRPPAIRSERALQLLHKASVLKGSLKAADVAEFLRELGHLQPEQTSLARSDTRFIMLLRYSVENLRQFSHAQLLQVLESFVWLALSPAHSILGQFESELIQRAPQMSLPQLLLAADLWRCLKKPVPQFLQQLYDSVELQHMGVAELVQLVYIMGEGRHCPKDLVGRIETILLRHLDKLEPEEVGTVCLGLFKSQTSLSERAVACLVDKAHSVVGEMTDFAMVNVMKLLRFSHLDHKVWLEVMAQEVPRRVPGMGVMGLMHVTLACSALHYRSDAILMSVAERLPSLAQQCRSKDSCKLLWSFGTLGIPPSQCPDLYSSLVAAMRQRKAEFEHYPEHLLTGLLGLAFVEQFPEDLLALALSPEFVSQALKKTQLELSKDLFTLDGTVGLELPHWTGPRLAVRPREEAAKMLWRYAQTDICQKPEVLEAERLLQDLLGGRQFVCKRMILPHTRSIDLLVHLDPAGIPLPVNVSLETAIIPEKSLSTSHAHKKLLAMVGVRLTEDLLTQMVSSKKDMEPSGLSHQSSPPALLRLEADEGVNQMRVESELATTMPRMLTDTPTKLNKTMVKLAIQVSNRNHYCYQSEQLMGLHALKRRQLHLAGYRVVELNHWEWFPLLRKRQAEKLAYLHCKIYGSMD
ncbi:FAST kinase domain-containing protein 5, mitochondrial isoform X2 [Gadus chalcogrammus]|nr:FAST kinase domain-containing protein 5, mitochondrial isoform X2 [Gadus chalcogrammus]